MQSIIFYIKLQLMTLTTMWKLDDALYFCTSLDSNDLDSHGEEYRRDNCSQQSEKLLLLLCTARFSVHNLLYVMLSTLIFFLCSKGKLIAKRDENLFSYWLGGAECQDGGGQLWGKAGRPTTFCLSHA